MNFRKPGWLPPDVTDQQWHDFNISVMVTMGIVLAVLLLFAKSCLMDPMCTW